MTVNWLDFGIGALLATVGGWSCVAKPVIPRLSGASAASGGELAVENATTQRMSAFAVAFLGACFLADAFLSTDLTFKELGVAVLFGASAREHWLDVKRLKAAGRPTKWRRISAIVGDLAAALFLLGFTAQFVPALR